jgi:L-2-hydroxyglutarate oxidase LhgO
VPSNAEPMPAVARDNFALTEYLVAQVLQSEKHRFAALRAYFPEAREGDWRLPAAGCRLPISVFRSSSRTLKREGDWNSGPSSSRRTTARWSRFSALLPERQPRLIYRDQPAAKMFR